MITRRNLLKGSSLLALAPAVPGFLARTARAGTPVPDGRVLVVVQLDGGNDGLNTVVPYRDDGYARLRPTLRLPRDELIAAGAETGFHRGLRGFQRLFEAGQVAVVQGVGYPNPTRSHFEAMAVWHTARRDVRQHTGLGWVGRAMDGAATGVPAAFAVGPDAVPVALRGRRAVAVAVDRAEDFVLAPGPDPGRALGADEPADDLTAFVRRTALDAYAAAGRVASAGRAATRYPETDLGSRLALVSRLLKAGAGARVWYTLQPGYDTHATQARRHLALLAEFSGAVQAFFDDLKAAGLADRVAVLAFSEFGRRVAENGSGGTDHGTAGPVFLAGPRVTGGLLGQAPNLADLEDGDLKARVDFRQVYATVLEDWLGLPAKVALGRTFDRLSLFRP